MLPGVVAAGLFLFGDAKGGELFRQQMGQQNFFVIIKSDNQDMAEYAVAMLKDALHRSPGFTTLDRETVQKLKADEIIWRRLEDADPSVLKDISKKYSVSYELVGFLTVEKKRSATQYEGSATLSIRVIRTADGVEVGTAVSSPVGGLDNPGPIRELALPAMQSAVTLVTNDIIGKLSLPGGFEPDNVVNLKLTHKLSYPLDCPPTAIALSSSNMCYVGTNKYILCYNLLSNTSRNLFCNSAVSSIAVWPDNTILITGHSDGSVRTWRPASGDRTWEAKPINSKVTSLAILHENGLIAAGGEDGTITLFDVNSSTPLKKWSAHNSKAVQSLGFTYDGKYLLSAGADKNVCKWDIRTGKLVFSFLECTEPGKRYLGDLFAAAFTREGNIVAVAFREIYIPKFERFRVDKNYLCLHDCEGVPPTEQYRFEAHDKEIESLTLCPTSCRFLASGARDGKVKIWDMQLRNAVFEDYVGGWIADIAFSPEANWFAVITHKGEGLFDKQNNSMLKVWQIE
jgi:WD40 repeat protein